MRNGCRDRIADMTVPEALRVDTDGGIKPDMAFLALLVDVLPGFLDIQQWRNYSDIPISWGGCLLKFLNYASLSHIYIFRMSLGIFSNS